MSENLKIDYNEQMLNYYPEVIKAIREFQVLISTQSLQIEELHKELVRVLEDAYVGTAGESRIAQWEKFLGIAPSPQGDDSLETWLSDRRDTILAKLYSTTRLNTQSIADIVKIFTGGSAQSYFRDGTIYVIITPPQNNRSYKFANVEQALREKIPAHLMFKVDRNYYEWGEIMTSHPTWKDISDNFSKWEDVLLYVPSFD